MKIQCNLIVVSINILYQVKHFVKNRILRKGVLSHETTQIIIIFVYQKYIIVLNDMLKQLLGALLQICMRGCCRIRSRLFILLSSKFAV